MPAKLERSLRRMARKRLRQGTARKQTGESAKDFVDRYVYGSEAMQRYLRRRRRPRQ